jgi:hypothetical protein
MAVRNLPEEQELRECLRKSRDNFKRIVAQFDDDELEKDNLNSAIMHQYSILARLEYEFENVPSDEELVAQLDNADTYYDKDEHKEYTTIETRALSKLRSRLERLEAKLNRVTILGELSRVNRMLGQQAGQQAQMDEIKAKTEHIKIETHAAVLKALKDIFYLALRRLGYSDGDLRNLAKEMIRIEKDYPIIQEDFSKIRSRLFATPDEVPKMLEADYRVLDDVQSMNELVNGVKREPRKR